MSQQRYLSSSAPPEEDDMYNVTPQRTGISAVESVKTTRENEQQHGQRSHPENPFADYDDKPPALPPRRSSSFTEHAPPPMYPSNGQHGTYLRSKEHVVAYMIPLPPPRGPDGQCIKVPDRFMLYLPPAPDLVKPPADSDTKERKRDKCARKWQGEVRKAKTFSGSIVSFSGLYCASVRGAVYCLSFIQRSELTFLSRLPRKTLQELEFVHPAGEATQDRRRFELIKEELKRNKFVAKRDFWIGVVLLPFAQTIDFLIPVGGGFSEVTLVWVIITGGAWRTASGMMKRLVFQDEVEMRTMSDGHHEAGATAGPSRGGLARAFTAETGDENDDLEKGGAASPNINSKPSPWWKKKPAPPVSTVFRASTSLDPLARYLQAACFARNAAAFPDVGAPDTEAGVLTSIGWAPAQRSFLTDEERAADVAWQIRQATEDLREATTKAAKSWDSFCKAYVKDPEKALREEEKEAAKRARRAEKERMKSARKG